MSKKDYILIAKVLKGEKWKFNSFAYNPWGDYVEAFAKSLKEENPKFDVDKFYKACDYKKKSEELD